MNRQSAGRPWGFSTALDNVAGALLFGVAPNEPGARDMALQLRLAGAAPEVGECHFAFPSDCSPWSSTGEIFVAGDEVPEEGGEATCSTLARVWKDLGNSFVRGDCSGSARWIPGCPVRVVFGRSRRKPCGGGDSGTCVVRDAECGDVESS